MLPENTYTNTEITDRPLTPVNAIFGNHVPTFVYTPSNLTIWNKPKSKYYSKEACGTQVKIFLDPKGMQHEIPREPNGIKPGRIGGGPPHDIVLWAKLR